jgi:hypothetical protein
MNAMIRYAAVAALLLCTASAASAGVTVTYAQADKFTDVPFAEWERERLLKDLDGHFAKLAAKLPPGQELKVEVLNLDLAGQVRHNYGGTQDLRVLRGGADWPHMHLRYTLLDNGQVLKQGDAQLSNMSYLQRMNSYDRGDTLRYEKQMLDDWFKTTLAMK